MHHRCKTLVYAFQDYLRERFPRANTTIRNESNESIALSFARMIMANQTIIGVSTFSKYPAVASFGNSFIQLHPRATEKDWVRIFARRYNNVLHINEHVLPSQEAKRLWGTNGSAVIDFLERDNEASF